MNSTDKNRKREREKHHQQQQQNYNSKKKKTKKKPTTTKAKNNNINSKNNNKRQHNNTSSQYGSNSFWENSATRSIYIYKRKIHNTAPLIPSNPQFSSLSVTQERRNQTTSQRHKSFGQSADSRSDKYGFRMKLFIIALLVLSI